MLKKIMKAALAASLVFGMSSFAYAADFSVGGKFRAYFGQYDEGSENASGDKYSANFKSFEEANVKFKGTAGKLSLYHEMETKGDTDFNNTQTKLSYALPFGLLSIGNMTSIGTIPMSTSGWTTSNIPYATRRALSWSGYSENEGIGLVVPLEGVGKLQFIVYEDSSNAAGSTAKGIAAAMGATTPTSTEGSSMQAAADLKFGKIAVRAGYATAKTDDPENADDDAMTTNNMLLGARIPLGDAMSIGLDYATSKVSYDAWSDDLTTTCMDADFQMSGIGPGKLIVSIDMTTVKGDDKLYDRTVSSLVFDAPVAKGAGFQIGYIANAKKPEGGDTVTETFLGGGLYASF